MRLEDIPRDRLESIIGKFSELRRREERARQQAPGGLLHFIRYFWSAIEPGRPLIEGWPLEAICEHLEAVTRGEITRLLINIPPGFMKSLAVNVFWPAWEWGPMEMPTLRYVAASYSQGLTVRDNIRFRNIIMSPEYKSLWGDVYGPSQDQFNIVKVANNCTGWKLATSVGGIGTGERGDRFIIDDGNNVREAESDAVRDSTNQWVREVVPTRLNDAETGVIVNVQQRTHFEDVSGVLLDITSKLPPASPMRYVHLRIPMEYDSSFNKVPTRGVGWVDPRSADGELAWPERFSRLVVDDYKSIMGPYATAGQFQQWPIPRGGGIIKNEWWNLYTPPDQVKDDRGRILRFGSYPPFELVVAAADTAYTEKEENDPTGFTVWGVWIDHSAPPTPVLVGAKDEDGNQMPAAISLGSGGQAKLMLIYAWRKRLELHGIEVPRQQGESDAEYFDRANPKWGLCEWIAWSCKRYKVDTLLIEGKASGLSVAQELRRLYANSPWSVFIDQPEGDKVARAYSIQSLFSNGLIYAPDRDWADMVIEETCAFPRHKFRDLTDSMTMALRYLRRTSSIQRRDEWEAELIDNARFRPKAGPLYPMA